MILRLVALALVMLSVGCQQRAVVLNQLQFVGALRSNQIFEAYIMYNPTSTNFREVYGQLRMLGQTANVPFIAKIRITDELAEEMVASGVFGCKML